MLIRKNLYYYELTDLTTPDDTVEICGIRLLEATSPIDIIACYRTPGHTLTQTQWDNIVQNTTKNTQCLLMGDFNAHNVV